MNKRQSEFQMSDYKLVLQEILENEFQQSLWKKYQKQYSYAKDTRFAEVIAAITTVVEKTEK